MNIQYERAPITEALIDIRVDLPPAAALADLERLHALVKDRYPGRKNRIKVEGQLVAGDSLGAVTKQTPMGFQFTSEDGKLIFQARLDGFTFSRLRPYGNWIELRNESQRLWAIYKASVNPLKITRIAVRYINQINIPLHPIDYKDYFLTTPEVSRVLPQGLSGFFMRLEFPQDDFGGMLLLTQTAVPPPTPRTHSVILDIDVFKEIADPISEEGIWVLLETLRNRKNQFFEGSITDRSRELFGERTEY